MPRRRAPRLRINGAGDQAILELLGTSYRLWAALPENVNALMALAPPPAPGEPSDTDKILAVVGRPTFPPGVCRTCGCTQFDPCWYSALSIYEGMTCGWADREHTQCTVCAGKSPDGREPDQNLTPRSLPPAPKSVEKAAKRG